jgi:hypothetical protein
LQIASVPSSSSAPVLAPICRIDGFPANHWHSNYHQKYSIQNLDKTLISFSQLSQSFSSLVQLKFEIKNLGRIPNDIKVESTMSYKGV